MRNLNINLARNNYMKLYDMFDEYKQENLGISELVGGSQLNVHAFKNLFPIIVFDERKQSEKLKAGVQDIQVRFEFGTLYEPDTPTVTATAIMISYRFFQFSSDGKNMSVMSK